MPFEQKLLLLALAGAAAFFVLWLLIPRARRSGGTCETLGDEADLDKRPVGKHPALGAGYREGPTFRGSQRADRDVYGDGAYGSGDKYGKPVRHPDERPAPRPQFGKRAASITLTPRHLEHVNILRRRDGKPPLNANGFKTAIALQARATEPRAVNTTNDWLAYLIGYAILSNEHQQSRVACEHTITISPDAPFNGQGGVFGGTD